MGFAIRTELQIGPHWGGRHQKHVHAGLKLKWCLNAIKNL